MLGGVGVLILAAFGIGYLALASNYAPSASVSRFLDLVVKGQSKAAVATLQPAPDGNRSLVADDVYAAAKHRIMTYRILSTVIRGSQAIVQVELTTDAGSWKQPFELVTGRKVLLFDVWTVDGTSFPTVELDDGRPAGVTVTANGVPLSSNGEDSAVFLALPGDYRFAIESDTTLVTADSHDALVSRFDTSKKVALQVQLTADGVASARTAVDDFLQACIAQPVLAPTGNCGYSVMDTPGATLSNINWSIKQRPIVSFDPWKDGGWTVKTDTAGSLEMDADFRTSREYGQAVAVFDSYDIQGYVALDGKGGFVFTSTYEGDAANQPNA
ncbi:hypothetical protein ACFPJ4_02185 [Lysinimonas soli]|uniref:Uncharacterized protein n=1 Tax=Lysinimonas soli TaxID=1074233 RepID=A0ABW0NN69_9MICO